MADQSPDNLFADLPTAFPEELIEVLHDRQRPDGSWVNVEPRWYEHMPVLVTAYSVLALKECLKVGGFGS